jgi:phosphopantothenoylcysteine decarboxylase/phosphopantothenate--cysteine ligase
MTPDPRKPRVLLGVTGSVAAYKAVELIKALRPFTEVRVVVTEAGSKLVPLSALKKASGFPVWKSLFAGSTPIPPGTPSGTHPMAAVPHIDYAKQADLILIAPATANCMAKLALGIADDLLTSLCLYAECPIWLAPAMNVNMWNHSATRNNQRTLLARGVRFLGPDKGWLACGDVGEGRFAEPTEIALQVESYFKKNNAWKDLRVLVTAGPTQEALDPVRVLSNHSSGKMGYALAHAALNRGAQVTLVHGPVSLAPLTRSKMVPVTTALQMRSEVLKALPKVDLIVMAAAVADYRPAKTASTKIKKSKNNLILRLTKNPDILGEVLKRRKPGRVVVGFAAETDHLRVRAGEKWNRKPCDLLAANRVGKGRVFGTDQNELLVFSRMSTKPVKLGPATKARIAEDLLDLVEKLLTSRSKGRL